MSKRLLAFGVVVCLCLIISTASVAQQDVKSTVTSIEKSLWEAWKNKQTGPFEQHLTDNTIGISSTGVFAGKEEVIKDLTAQPCDVRSFSLSAWEAS